MNRARRRAWPIAVTVGILVTALAYCLLWGPVVGHRNSWTYPGDIWGAYRSAHFIAWGAFGSVYAAGTGLVTFPGVLLLLTPLASLTGHLGMSEGFPNRVPHPTSWLLLGPYEIIIGCVALFACDALAERMWLSRGRRSFLCVVEGVVLWPVLVMWGHPEDALAVGLAVYALVFALDGRWTGAGWLFGAALATQPLVVLMLPVLLAMSGRSRVLGLVVRSGLPAALLLVTPVLAQFHTTVHALVDQPNFPVLDHATPWTALAPRLGGAGKDVAVAAGPGRLAAVLAACALGWWARRWRDRPDLMVWAVAAALSLRCFTESVMVAFYLWPVLAVGLVVVASSSGRRVALGVASAVAVTVCGEFRLGEWEWWATMALGLVVLLVSGFPSRSSRVPTEVPIDTNAAGGTALGGPAGALVGATR
ncbi:MAG TPA: hypothetical protein VMV22_01170 [Acidimicrobiales bacterium]|nr:hypothetical protein [Acidimicrobiales bacterium]